MRMRMRMIDNQCSWYGALRTPFGKRVSGVGATPEVSRCGVGVKRKGFGISSPPPTPIQPRTLYSLYTEIPSTSTQPAWVVAVLLCEPCQGTISPDTANFAVDDSLLAAMLAAVDHATCGQSSPNPDWV